MVDTRTQQHRRRNATAMQAIEGNPLTVDDRRTQQMMDRQGWQPAQRRAYIIANARRGAVIAAE